MPCYIPNNTAEAFVVEDGECYQRSMPQIVLGSCSTFLLALTSIIGNTAVVTVSYFDSALRVQGGNLLIVYLALTDIMTSLFVMLPSAIAVASDGWPLGKIICKVNAIFNYTFFCSSSFNICLISVDRVVAVVFPLKYPAWMTTRLMIGFCAWLFLQNFTIGLFCGMPDWIIYDYKEGVCTIDYDKGGSNLDPISVAASTICYWIPAFFMGTCNAVIIYTANRSRNKVQPLFVTTAQSQMRKTIKSLLVIVLTYYVCYTPFNILKQLKIHGSVKMPSWLDYLTTTLIFTASATNPLIYAIFRKDYREAFKKLFKTIYKKFSSFAI